MNLFKFVGGEYVDPMIPESIVEFHFSIFAKTLNDAMDAFYEVFPGCVVVQHSVQVI